MAAVFAENSESSEKAGDFGLLRNVPGMRALVSTLLSWLACRFGGHAELELELIALRHQVPVLNRQRRSRLRWYSVDRMLWVWIYRV